MRTAPSYKHSQIQKMMMLPTVATISIFISISVLVPTTFSFQLNLPTFEKKAHLYTYQHHNNKKKYSQRALFLPSRDSVVGCYATSHNSDHDNRENCFENRQNDDSQQDNNDIVRNQRKSTNPIVNSNRRSFLQASPIMIAASTSMVTPKPSNAALLSGANRKNPFSLNVVSPKKDSDTAAAMRQPDARSFFLGPGLGVESCMLKLLPVKNSVFRTLEKDISSVSVLRGGGDAFLAVIKPQNTAATEMKDYESQGGDDKDEISSQLWKDIQIKVQGTIKYLDDQRSKLEPVFNQEDPTILFLSKAERGERLIEELRSNLSNIVKHASNRNSTATLESQRMALRKLSEIGELLIPSFPYDVPQEGKFSYLPRLAGRAEVTFTITRRSKKSGGIFGFGQSDDSETNAVSNTNGKDQVLGNVTIVADGFAAPITAGNFVDLSARGFYTGLPIKEVKKRFGVNPTLTLAEDNVVAYDIANTLDKITGQDGVVQKTLNSIISEGPGSRRTGNADDGTILTPVSILGSFGEGFYDPLTAKPRRIPLEIVQYDRISGVAKLSYASGFSGYLPQKSSLSSVLPTNSILLNFNIPALVAMNHPDKNLNGGSSEFFSLTNEDIKRDEMTTLLNGSYAPFGYITAGLDIMQDLRCGAGHPTDDYTDEITATYVDDWGLLNLVKIRGSSFADAINSSGDEE